VTGRVEDVTAAVAYARTLGWELDRPVVAVVAELDPAARSTEPAQAARAASWRGLPSPTPDYVVRQLSPGPAAAPAARSTEPAAAEVRPVRERFVAAWQTVVRSRDPRAPVVNFNDEVLVLLGAPADGDVDRLVADLDRLVQGDGGLGRRPFSLGVSRVAALPDALPLAYEQARKAIRIGRRLHGHGARASFDRLGVHRLISLIPDSAELRGYVDEVLGELAADSPDNADLRHTLEVLLDTNCNVAEAARRLHFHYNTLRYRISKLEKAVGPFMTVASLRLDLGLALRVLEIRGL